MVVGCLGVVSAGIYAINQRSNQNDKLREVKESNSIPKGFQTSPLVSYSQPYFTFASDHELLGRFSKLQLQSDGDFKQVSPDQMYVAISDVGQERTCKVVGQNLTRIDMDSGMGSPFQVDESIGIRPFEGLRYTFPGMPKNLVQSECNPVILSLDGKATVSLAKSSLGLGCIYWKPVHGFIDQNFTSDGSRNKIAIRKNKDRSVDNTISVGKVQDPFGIASNERWIHAMIGVDSEDRLIFSWKDSREGRGICRGRMVDGQVEVEEAVKLDFSEFEPTAVSLDGNYMVFTRFVSQSVRDGHHEIVMLNLETYEEKSIGSFERTRVLEMGISPKNKFVVLRLPNSVAWQNIQSLKWKPLNETAPWGKSSLIIKLNR